MDNLHIVTFERLALGSRIEMPLLEGQVAYLQQWPSRYVVLEPHPTFKRTQIAFSTDDEAEIDAIMRRHSGEEKRAYRIL
jgi:hypothetical protein